MNSFSHLKISKKIAIALGGIVLLLAGVAGISLWGIHTLEQIMRSSVEQLTMSQLAQQVAAEQSNISISVGKMVVAKHADPALLKEVQTATRDRDANLKEFRTRAITPESAKHASDMEAIALHRSTAADLVIANLNEGHYEQGVKEYIRPLGKLSLRAKAKEASQWQLQLVANDEKHRKATSAIV